MRVKFLLDEDLFKAFMISVYLAALTIKIELLDVYAPNLPCVAEHTLDLCWRHHYRW